MEKIKNMPVFRMLAFAIAIAIILGLSSAMLSFTASAAAADDVVSQLGTLANYDCVKYKAGQHISFEFLRSIYNRFNSPYVCGVVLGYKDGKFVSISKSSTRVTLGYRSTTDSSLLFSYCTSNLYESCYPDEYDVYYHYFRTSDDTGKYGASSFRSKNGKGGNGGFIVLADSYSDYVNRFGDTCYFVYTTSSTKWSDTQFLSLEQDIIDNLNDSNYKDFTPPPTGGSENGRFICFGNYKEYKYDEHLADILSESIEYTKPTNKNTYWGRGTCYFRDDSASTDWSSNRVATKQIIEYASTEIAFSYFNDSDDLGACSVRLSLTEPRFMEREVDTPLENPIKYLVQHKLSYFHHARNVVISCDSFRNIPANSTMTAKFDLTGFVPLGGSSYVLLELVDTITGNVVSSVMIHSPVNNGKVSKDNDKIDVNYGYKEGNTTDIDINEPDDTGHLNGVPGGGLDDSNRKFVSNYENASISDIFGTLDSSVNSISDFFQMTWGLLPIAISTIIIGGFAILILLRILGR